MFFQKISAIVDLTTGPAKIRLMRLTGMTRAGLAQAKIRSTV